MAKPKLQKGTVRRVLRYLKRYIPLILLSLIMTAGNVILSLYIPILCGRAIDLMVGKGLTDINAIVTIVSKIAVCAGLGGIFGWIANVINNQITYSVVCDVRRDAFDTILHLPLSYIDTHPSGGEVSRVISDVDVFADGLILGFTQFFSGILTILFTLGFMITINAKITAIVVLLTPMSMLFASFVSKKTYSLFREQSETRSEMTAYLNEIVSEQPLVRAFSKERETVGKFSDLNDVYEKKALRAIFFSSLVNPTTRFVNNIVYAVVCLFGAFAVMSGGGISVGGLTSFLAYSTQYSRPFNEISGVVTELQNALACAGRVFALIDENRELPDKDGAAALRGTRGRFDIENVSFSYTEDKELIKNLSLHVSPGERVAIVGPTGCGKTTIINLLMRFYDVNSGSIKLDGHDIRDVTRRSLRESYGMVLQDTWIAGCTVRENILMGRDATDDEIIEAAKKAHAHSFIRRLPDGYDTVLSDENCILSAGQRQLLCIARVMLRIPPVLILDEATSSIDTRTEMKIQKAFATMMEGRTSFIVAHRLSTIKEADVILVMRDGRIEESGKHEELLRRGGFYETLWNSQFAKTE